MSDFLSLYTAFSGLQAAQAGIDTTSHNVANAGTEGYTRQRVELRSRLPHQSPFGEVGSGVSIVDITRGRHALVDARWRSSISSQAASVTLGELLARNEAALAEPDTGITAALGSMWSALEDLALDPPDTGARIAVLSQFEATAERFRTLASAWDRAGEAAMTEYRSAVDETNTLLRQVADLNGRILSSKGTPGSDNDLLDRRDMVVDRLSSLAGVNVSETSSGTLRVSVGGLALVHDGAVSPLTLAADGRITHSTGAFVEPGGTLAGYRTYLTTELPAHRAALDRLAADLADAMNAQHAAGYTSAGSSGGQLFAYTTGAAARTLSVAITDVAGLAVAGSAGPPVAAYDGTNIEAMVALRSSAVASGGASLDEAARSVVATVAGATAGADAAAAAAGRLSAAAEGARLSAHGVSIDEEMVGLLTYQRAYEAAARVMTAIDQTLDTLINRTGVVGR